MVFISFPAAQHPYVFAEEAQQCPNHNHTQNAALTIVDPSNPSTANSSIPYSSFFNPSKKPTNRFLITTPTSLPVPSSVTHRCLSPSFPNTSTAYSRGAFAQPLSGV